MQRTDTEAFASLMAVLAEVFSKEVTSTLTEIYFRTFSDMPIEDFEEAVWLYVKKGVYFPKPVELTETLATHRYLTRERLREAMEEARALNGSR